MSDKKNKANNNNNGSLPNHVVNLLNEYTVGGFIIFYFNQETGEPEEAMSFDSPAHSLALQKHMEDWQEAIHEVKLGNAVEAIQDAVIASQIAKECETQDNSDEEYKDSPEYREGDDDEDDSKA